MSEAIIVALLSLAGTLFGSFAGIMAANKLVNYRLQELENKVEKHIKNISQSFTFVKACFNQISALNSQIAF